MSKKRYKNLQGNGQVGELLGRFQAKYPEVEVWAAGGVVLRECNNNLEVLVIHRSSHQDWSFPKGKLEEGETLGKAACREVLEETGFRCKRADRLPMVRYFDARRRRKAVVYWTMEVLDGCFEPNVEVDGLGWFDFSSAKAILSYRHDVTLLKNAATAVSSVRLFA